MSQVAIWWQPFACFCVVSGTFCVVLGRNELLSFITVLLSHVFLSADETWLSLLCFVLFLLFVWKGVYYVTVNVIYFIEKTN